jgi:hypothetical protein
VRTRKQRRELILIHDKMTEERTEKREGIDWNTLAQNKRQWRVVNGHGNEPMAPVDKFVSSSERCFTKLIA